MSALERHLRKGFDWLRTDRQARRSVLLLLLGAVLWVTAISLWGEAGDLRSRMILQEDRFRRLAQVVRSYRNQPRQETKKAPSGDILSILSSLIDQVGVKDRLVQLSAGAAGATLQLERLYGEELATLLQELERKDLPPLSVELRSVPQGETKRFSCSILVGGERR